MPSYAQSGQTRPPPIERPHLAPAAARVRRREACRACRFDRVEVWRVEVWRVEVRRIAVGPDRFGRARGWRRLGRAGRPRLEPHADPGAAIPALARTREATRRRGERDRKR